MSKVFNVLITGDTKYEINAMLAKYIFIRKPNNDIDFHQAEDEIILSISDHDFDVINAIRYAMSIGSIGSITLAGFSFKKEYINKYREFIAHNLNIVPQDYNTDEVIHGLITYWHRKFPNENMPPLFGFFIPSIKNTAYTPTGVPFDYTAKLAISAMYNSNPNINFKTLLTEALVELESDVKYIAPQHSNFTIDIMYNTYNRRNKQ